MVPMEPQLWKVGELAQRSGLSVRALHHYDEIGLLLPSRRSPAGHRLYTAADVERLLRIRALQQLGFPLERIRACLDDAQFSPVHVLDLQLAQLRTQAGELARLVQLLTRLRDRLAGAQEVTIGEFLDALTEMSMFEKYYTPEQLRQLEQRAQQLGPERIRAVEMEWPQLIAAVRTAWQNGTPPDDPQVRALAARWQQLIDEFTGGDPGIRASLARMWQQESSLSQQNGIEPDMHAYVRAAMERS